MTQAKTSLHNVSYIATLYPQKGKHHGKLLTVAEAAQQYGKTEPAFRWMIHQGIAPKSAKIGGRRLFRQEDIDQHIATAFGGSQ